MYALAMMLWSLWFRRDPWPRSFSAYKIMAMVTRGRRPPLRESTKPLPPPPPPPSAVAEGVAEGTAEAAVEGAPTPTSGAAPATSLLPEALVTPKPTPDAGSPSPLLSPQAYHNNKDGALAINSSAHSTTRSSAHDKLAPWGDLTTALPLLPALERLIVRMWSHSHDDRPELPAAMDVFAREVRNLCLGVPLPKKGYRATLHIYVLVTGTFLEPHLAAM